ncbi:efflux RND transporter permease subunit [Teredinibacter turnerae]|uniref:efflux RND transporter permease subunit n=1 Tax=Teredinibacter turnerae TaxID=2426 RepID=UPI0003F8E97C|nr:efflux RND transporter permease subunit [Teredinibacter turnerae]
MNENKGFLAQFIAHPIASKTLLAIFILLGVLGAFSLRQEVFPPFAPNRVDIFVAVRGATASEVEELVVRSVEQKLVELTEIDRIIATAYQDYAQFQLELVPDVDPYKALTLIKSQVESIRSFPSYAEPPVYSVPKTTGPLLLVNLYGDLPVRVLYGEAIALRDSLSLLPGITQVEVEDAPEIEVAITASPEQLRKYDLRFSDIADVISANALNLSAGELSADNGRILLRGDTQAVREEDFGELVVAAFAGGNKIYLRDIADVRIGPVESYVNSRFNGQPSFTLSVRRDKYLSLSTASERVRTFVTNYQTRLGSEVGLTVWADDSREFSSRVSLLLKNGITGFLIICIVMTLFVHVKVAFWTAVGIPVSMLGALGLLYISGTEVSLNAITLFGFLIAAGLIVDDAIVIGESIHEETLAKGEGMQSAVSGAHKVAMPTVFGALTSIAAFFPLTLTEGKMGSQMAGIGTVVICCLFASIIESKLVLPNHLAGKWRSRFRGFDLSKIQARSNGVLNRFSENTYSKGLIFSLRRPWLVVALVLVILFASVSILIGGVVRTVTLPNIADYEVEGSFTIDANLSPVQRSQIADALEQSLYATSEGLKKEHNLEFDPVMMNAITVDTTRIIIAVEISHRDDAPFDAHQVANLWRERLPLLPGIESANIASGPNGDEQVAIQLSGNDLETIYAAKEEVKSYLGEIDGVVDIRDSALTKSTELLLQVNPFGESLGLTQAYLLAQIRTGFYGLEAQRVQVGEQEWRVMVRLAKSHRQTESDLANMEIQLPNGRFLPLERVATIKSTRTETMVQRIDGQRAVTVYANTLGNVDAEGVAEGIVEDFLPGLQSRYTGLSYSIEGEAKDAAKSIRSLINGSIIAVFVMFVLMAIPLKSYLYPAVIMLLLPLGFIGTIVGHLLVPIDYSLISMFGLIALMGVMINNGLLLIDQYLVNIEQGMEREKAVVESCTRRFRPILLTALTTFAGLMPLIWESDPEALWLVPIAVSLGIGILVSTGLTLIVLPVVLVLLPKKQQRSINTTTEAVFTPVKTSEVVQPSISSVKYRYSDHAPS